MRRDSEKKKEGREETEKGRKMQIGDEVQKHIGKKEAGNTEKRGASGKTEKKTWDFQ